jgi:hypothetical protein
MSCDDASSAGPPTSSWRGPALLYTACTIVALFFLVRLRVGLNYSPRNLALMLTIYGLAALPFFSGGLTVTLAIRAALVSHQRGVCVDLIGAAAGCLVLIPLLDRLGAPGRRPDGAALSAAAAALFAPRDGRSRIVSIGAAMITVSLAGNSPASRCSTSSSPRVISATVSSSANGIRSHGSASMNGRTATGRSATRIGDRCLTRGTWISTRLPRRRSSASSRICRTRTIYGMN